MAIITAADLKTHLGITDAADDTTVGYAVNAANAAVVSYCGRSFDKVTVGSETARVFYPRNSICADVDDFWDVTNLAVKTDSGDDGTYETTWTTADYQVEPLNGRLQGLTVPYWRIRAVGSYTFPTTNDRPSVQITAAWGWTAVPDAVFEAALIKAARLFKRKDSPEGVLGGFADIGAVRVTNREDPDVVALLAFYRRAEAALVGR